MQNSNRTCRHGVGLLRYVNEMMNLKAKRRERKARKAASGTPNRIATPTGSVSPDRDRRSDVQRLMLFGFESERHLGLTDLGPRAMEGSGWAMLEFPHGLICPQAPCWPLLLP